VDSASPYTFLSKRKIFSRKAALAYPAYRQAAGREGGRKEGRKVARKT